jgi:hypothetical protein
MALTQTRIGNAKARDGEYKPADGGGLYLLVTPRAVGSGGCNIGRTGSNGSCRSVNIRQ